MAACIVVSVLLIEDAQFREKEVKNSSTVLSRGQTAITRASTQNQESSFTTLVEALILKRAPVPIENNLYLPSFQSLEKFDS